MAFLDLIHISKRFSKFVAVEDFNLYVERGEFISFLGPSGCGKTTTLRMIAGFETPTEGEILIEGADISNKAPNQRNVGMVFQSYALFPNMTVSDNIGFGMKVAHKPGPEIKERVDEMLALIQMTEFGGRYPYQLSGGQQQRVALARALAIRPNVLLLDEPLSALDAKIRLELRNEIRTIQQKLGITTIYVTHDQEEALTLSDRVVVMRKGKIEQIGSPFEIYNFPKTHFVASFVGTLNFMNVKVKDAQEGLLEIENQTFRTASPVDAVNGETILTAIRPELLSLEGDPEIGNHFNCQVARITFLGSVVRIQVLLGEKLIFMDTFNNPHLVLPKEGDQVPVYFSKEAALVLHVTD